MNQLSSETRYTLLLPLYRPAEFKYAPCDTDWVFACEGYEACLAGIQNLLLAFSFLILSLKKTWVESFKTFGIHMLLSIVCMP